MKPATATPGVKLKKLKLKAYEPSEHDEQCVLVEALEMLGCRYFAIPNYRKLDKGFVLWTYLLKEGFAKGIPDVFVCEARPPYHGMFIEMKRRSGGVVSPEQNEWHAALRARGYYVTVARGAGEAISEATNYLRGTPGL